MPGFIHLSDLHFGRINPIVVDALLDKIELLQCDQVIISGDLTQRARDDEFRAAADFIRQIGRPVFIVPGNHDQPAALVPRFTDPWSRWRRYIAEQTEPAVSTAQYQIIGINSARPWGWYLDWSRGQISDIQIQKSCATLAAAKPGRLRLLVAHHPFWLPASQKHRGLIQNAATALRQLHHHGLDLLLGGHVHSAYDSIESGIIVCHAGTTTSTRLIAGQPNSFNYIQGNHDALCIQQVCWNNSKFEVTRQKSFLRESRGWIASAA